MNCGNCLRCLEGEISYTNIGPLPVIANRMILCSICGNKRCPHATDHELSCTDSNDVGQAGSAYSSINFKTLEE